MASRTGYNIIRTPEFSTDEFTCEDEKGMHLVSVSGSRGDWHISYYLNEKPEYSSGPYKRKTDAIKKAKNILRRKCHCRNMKKATFDPYFGLYSLRR